MAFFGSLKNSLKQKWLQYFQSNRFWISLHSGAVATPDGGKRPPSYLILGIINALEPQLAELMLPFSKLNPNVDTLIEVLGLNFDPDLMLGNSSQSTIEVQEKPQVVEVSDLLVDTDESVVVIDETDAFTVTSLDQIMLSEIEEETLDNTAVVINSSEDFSDMFLGGGDEAIGEFNLTANNDLTEAEVQAQDAQDISGLFPNF